MSVVQPADPAPIVSAPLPEPAAPVRDEVPAVPWLLGGLAVAQATAAVAVLLGTGNGAAVAAVASVDAALALWLGAAAAVAALRRPPSERSVALTTAACAVAAGAGATAVATPLLAAAGVLSVVAVLALRSVRTTGVVLAVTLAAVALGSAAAVVRGAGAAGAVLSTGLVAGAVVLVVGLRRALAHQAAVVETARQSAETLRVNDALTGVLNRRGLGLMAAPMIELSRRRGEAVHALFVDVDGFSLVNAELGYERGDDLLVAVAEALNGSVRQTDLVCRVGGDEFVVVGPGTGTSPLEMERRMREILRAAPPVDETVWPSRLSIGSATLVPWDDGDLGSLLNRADADMRLRRSLRRQSQDRRGGDLASPPRDPSPRTEV
ncbi:diguanylate cyclase [Kineosporia sp. R_H_3]|uniref:GGDEF domain-containing protein n=1 Tax=Kineosporia sp. R_H_3 TaxID=1961848 RepID=UPI000B4BCBFF|nr:GGDEF domain-containing protein [Kineosporia sp. R_H_3]